MTDPRPVLKFLLQPILRTCSQPVLEQDQSDTFNVSQSMYWTCLDNTLKYKLHLNLFHLYLLSSKPYIVCDVYTLANTQSQKWEYGKSRTETQHGLAHGRAWCARPCVVRTVKHRFNIRGEKRGIVKCSSRGIETTLL